jgi:hypothetical protein
MVKGLFEGEHVDIESSQPTLQPGMAERARDTATDVSRTIGEVTAGLKAAVAELRGVLADARSGQTIPALRRATRQAPLTSLFFAFLLGAVLARRR